MVNKGNESVRDERFKLLLNGYLRSQAESDVSSDENHLDGDSIAAFLEGNLSLKESAPINNHLVSCSFCRHKTGQLLKLDLEFADEPAPQVAAEADPSSVASVLNGILGKIFGSAEQAVFAHEDNDEDEEKRDSDEEE